MALWTLHVLAAEVSLRLFAFAIGYSLDRAPCCCQAIHFTGESTRILRIGFTLTESSLIVSPCVCTDASHQGSNGL